MPCWLAQRLHDGPRGVRAAGQLLPIRSLLASTALLLRREAGAVFSNAGLARPRAKPNLPANVRMNEPS